MRLYKMELYKLCGRKMFIIGALCVIGVVLFGFAVKVSSEESVVDGIRYKGYQAVQKDRQITKEFEGILTDEKAEKIIEKYGFPSEVEVFYAYYRDANYLNMLVEKCLSNGYFNNWEDYKIATDIYSIEDTDLGAYRNYTGKEIVLEYNNGWLVFLNVLETGLILGSILVLYSVSTVFAGERQSGMLVLLFTTKEGKNKDIYAKIAAVFTIALGVWLCITVIGLLLCGIVYGYSGLHTLAGMSKISFYQVSAYMPKTMWSMGKFIVIVLLRSLLGMFLLCSITMCISALLKSPFNAVVCAAIVWVMPVLLWILLRILLQGGGQSLISYIILYIIRCLIFSSPIYMVMYDTIESGRAMVMLMSIAAALLIICSISSYLKYKWQQVV